MSERLTTYQLNKIERLFTADDLDADAAERLASYVLTALDELRERRAADLTDEERDALRVLAIDMKRAEMRSPDIMYYPPHLIAVRAVLDRLLAGKGEP